jgi:hypothetical protein
MESLKESKYSRDAVPCEFGAFWHAAPLSEPGRTGLSDESYTASGRVWARLPPLGSLRRFLF